MVKLALKIIQNNYVHKENKGGETTGAMEHSNLENLCRISQNPLIFVAPVTSHIRMPKKRTYKNHPPYFSTELGHFCISAPSAMRQRCTISP